MTERKAIKALPMVQSLKTLVKNSGTTYEELGRKMNLSTDTIKRLLGGSIPITLERVSEICEYIGIDVFELARISKFGEKPAVEILTHDQEKILAGDDALFAVYYLIVMGMSFDEIHATYKLSKHQLLKLAIKLEDLGILELHPENKLKLLVYRKIRWNMNGPLHNKYMTSMAMDFAKDVYESSDSFKFFFNCPLSKDSKVEVLRKLEKMCREIENISEMDLNIKNRTSTTMNIFVGAKNWMPEVTRKYSR